MKIANLFVLTTVCNILANCDSSSELPDSGLNPLRQPGIEGYQQALQNQQSKLRAGSYVTTGSNSTAFFSDRPADGSTAELLLPAGTMLRVIKSDSSFVKVELEDGKIGFVATAAVNPLESAVQNASTLPVLPVVPITDTLPPSGSSLPPSGSTLPPSPVENSLATPTLEDAIPNPPIAPPPLPAPNAALTPSSDELPPSSSEGN